MKKEQLIGIITLAFLCLFLFCLLKCAGAFDNNTGHSSRYEDSYKSTNGDSKIRDEKGKKYENYQECCAANDYEAAHQFLARLLNSEEGKRQYEEAKEYVFKNEALYLMSQDNETAKKRIIYLLKEEGGNNDHVSMLIDLAIENDDESFVKKLANQYSRNVKDESLVKLSDYLFSKTSQENVDYVITLLRKVRKEKLLLDDAIIGTLAKMNNKEISDILLSSLASLENDIPDRPDIGLVKAEESDFKYEDCGSHGPYIIKTKKYNNKCRTILNIAVASKNQYLAKESLSKMRPSISYKNLGDWEVVVVKSHFTSSSNAYRITINNEDINNAKAVYQQAVRSGAFK